MQQTIKPEHFKTTWMNQSRNLLAADIIGMGVEGAFITNIGKFDKAFPVVSAAIIKTLNVPMYYFQRPVETMLGYTKNFEGKDYYEKRLQKSEKERVETLSKAAYHYGMAWAVGWGSMFGAERMLSNVTHTPKIHGKYFFRDAAIHTGLIAVMATPMMAEPTQRLKDAIKCVSKVFGADEEKAEDLARISTFSFVPNFTTLGVVSGIMYRDLKLKSVHDALSATTATATKLAPHI